MNAYWLSSGSFQIRGIFMHPNIPLWKAQYPPFAIIWLCCCQLYYCLGRYGDILFLMYPHLFCLVCVELLIYELVVSCR